MTSVPRLKKLKSLDNMHMAVLRNCNMWY